MKRVVKEVVESEGENQNKGERESRCDAPSVACGREAVSPRSRSDPQDEQKQVIPSHPRVAQFCNEPHPLRGHALQESPFVV